MKNKTPILLILPMLVLGVIYYLKEKKSDITIQENEAKTIDKRMMNQGPLKGEEKLEKQENKIVNNVKSLKRRPASKLLKDAYYQSKLQGKFLKRFPKGTKVKISHQSSFVDKSREEKVLKDILIVETTLPSGVKRSFNASYNPNTDKIERTWGMSSFRVKQKIKMQAPRDENDNPKTHI